MTETKSPATAPSTGFAHVGFVTPDLPSTLRFWHDILGFEHGPIAMRSGPIISGVVGVEDASLRLAHLRGYGVSVEFIEYLSPASLRASYTPNRAGTAHICLWVADLDAMIAKIIEGGGSLQGQAVRMTEGPAAGRHGLYVKDPHDIAIELIEAAPDTAGN